MASRLRQSRAHGDNIAPTAAMAHVAAMAYGWNGRGNGRRRQRGPPALDLDAFLELARARGARGSDDFFDRGLAFARGQELLIQSGGRRRRPPLLWRRLLLIALEERVVFRHQRRRVLPIFSAQLIALLVALDEVLDFLFLIFQIQLDLVGLIHHFLGEGLAPGGLRRERRAAVGPAFQPRS